MLNFYHKRILTPQTATLDCSYDSVSEACRIATLLLQVPSLFGIKYMVASVDGIWALCLLHSQGQFYSPETTPALMEHCRLC